MPMVRPRKAAIWSSLLAVQQFAGDAHRAGIDAFQPGQHHQQRRLARAGRADDAGRFARRDIQADVLQHMDRRGALAKRQRHVLQFDDGFCHGIWSYMESLIGGHVSRHMGFP